MPFKLHAFACSILLTKLEVCSIVVLLTKLRVCSAVVLVAKLSPPVQNMATRITSGGNCMATNGIGVARDKASYKEII